MSPPNITSSGIVDRRPATARAPSADEAALETALAAHGIPTPQIRKLVRLAAPQPAEDRVVALTRAVAQLYLFNPLGAAAGRFLFIGAPGVGKTLAIAKLAARAKAHGRAGRTDIGARRRRRSRRHGRDRACLSRYRLPAVSGHAARHRAAPRQRDGGARGARHRLRRRAERDVARPRRRDLHRRDSGGAAVETRVTALRPSSFGRLANSGARCHIEAQAKEC